MALKHTMIFGAVALLCSAGASAAAGDREAPRGDGDPVHLLRRWRRRPEGGPRAESGAAVSQRGAGETVASSWSKGDRPATESHVLPC